MLGVGSAIHGIAAVNWHFVREMLLAWFTSPALGFVLTVITRFAILIAGKSPLLYTLVVPLVAGTSATLAFAVPAVIGPTSVKAMLAPTPRLLALEMTTVFTVVATIALVHCRQRVISGVDSVSTESVPLGGVDVNSTNVGTVTNENRSQGMSYVSGFKDDSESSLHLSKSISMTTSVPMTQLGYAGSEITAPQTVVNLEPHQHHKRKYDDDDASSSSASYTTGDNEHQPNTNPSPSPPRYGSMAPLTLFVMDENAPIFRALLICAVPAIAFAHGSNDVSNGVGPFYGIISYYLSSRTKDLGVDESDLSSSFILKVVVLVGGMAIALGIILFGGHVIATIGRGGISRVPWTFAQAFAAQSSAAAAILAASGLGIPVGTSHCVVGAVMGCAVKLPGTRLQRQTAVSGNGEGMRQREGEGESGEQEREGLSRVGSDGSFFNWPMLRNIGIGAVATPILSGSIAAVAVLSAKAFLN